MSMGRAMVVMAGVAGELLGTVLKWALCAAVLVAPVYVGEWVSRWLANTLPPVIW